MRLLTITVLLVAATVVQGSGAAVLEDELVEKLSTAGPDELFLVDLGAAGKDNNYGYGLIQCLPAIEFARTGLFPGAS